MSTPRCPVCRTRRATFTSLLKHQQQEGHNKVCQCGGYWFPHRPGSPCCDDNRYVRLNRAVREGLPHDDLMDALIDDIMLNAHPVSAECPF